MSEAISFSRPILTAAIELVSNLRPWSAPSLPGKPIPAAVSLSVDGDTATITTANFTASLSVDITCEAGGKGKTIIPLDALAAALRKAASDTIGLTLHDAGALLTAGRLRINLSSVARVTAPEAELGRSIKVQVPAALLRKGLTSTLPAATDDKKQPTFGGVYLHDAAGAAFAALDGKRIHVQHEDGELSGGKALLPIKLARLLLAVLPDDGAVDLSIGRRQIDIHANGIRIVSSLLDGTFPGYEPEFAHATSRLLRAPAAELLRDLELVSIVASQRDRDFRFALGGECRAFAFRREESGFDQGVVDLPYCEFSGAPLTIGFQLPLAADALSQFGNEVVEWRFGDAEAPSYLTSAALPGLRILLNPIRMAFAPMMEVA